MASKTTERAEPATNVGEHALAYCGPAGLGRRQPWQAASCSCGWGSALYLDKGNAQREWEEHARRAAAAA